jgi:SDR family mycofactocin-dependent oxidoreductase
VKARRAAIVGVYNTGQARRLEGITSRQLISQAALGALDDAGLTLSDVDGVTGESTPGTSALIYDLRLGPAWQGGRFGLSAVPEAISAVEADVVLIVASHAGAYTDRASTAPWTRPENEFVAPLGLFTAAEFALVARRHMIEFGTTAEQLAAIWPADRSRHPFGKPRNTRGRTMSDRVAGKVAFITGAARGQGRSHAVRLAQEGADIIAVDICEPVRGVVYDAATADDLAQTVKEVEALDRRIFARKADIRDLERLKQVAAEGIAELGRLDIVVANAAVLISGKWNEITPQIWQDTIDVNLTGTWNTLMATVPYLVDQGTGGSVILTSSTAGLKGLPFMNPYTVSKHGVTGMARAFAHELAPYSIRVNSVHPTGVNTTMGNGLGGMVPAIEEFPGTGGIFANSLPVRLVEPVDISNAVLYLASDEARYVTATATTVDAGCSQY